MANIKININTGSPEYKQFFMELISNNINFELEQVNTAKETILKFHFYRNKNNITEQLTTTFTSQNNYYEYLMSNNRYIVNELCVKDIIKWLNFEDYFTKKIL